MASKGERVCHAALGLNVGALMVNSFMSFGDFLWWVSFVAVVALGTVLLISADHRAHGQ